MTTSKAQTLSTSLISRLVSPVMLVGRHMLLTHPCDKNKFKICLYNMISKRNITNIMPVVENIYKIYPA
jgi:hypothetical protein